MTRDDAAKPVVLVADDTPANLSVLLELLSGAGYDVLIAEDGESALERASYARPDLILLDVLMPELDGFATCERLKAQRETRNIPVIFMTALADTVDKVRGFDAGAVDYVTKPFQPEELLARVRTHLTIQQLQTKLQDSEEKLSRIFESAMDAIVTVDAAGRVTLFNAAAEQVFRCGAPDAMGTSFARFLSEAFRAVLSDYTRGAEGAPKKPMWVPEGLTAIRADGEEFPVEATLSRVEATGAPLYTIILRDVNERRRAEAECRQLQGLNRSLQEEVEAVLGAGELVGRSTALARVVKSIEQVAPTDSTVLVTGETGTGKELVARAIHVSSRRKDKPLVKVNCAAIPAGLIESELFGHERGAFTGAHARKIGRFELAHEGTLFLDELGELPLDLQPKLLRVLQEGEFERAHILDVLEGSGWRVSGDGGAAHLLGVPPTTLESRMKKLGITRKR